VSDLNKYIKKTMLARTFGFVVFAVLAVDANALIILQSASASNSIDYDNNVTMSENAQSIWRYSLVPRYTISAANELNRWYSNVSVNIQRSSDKNLSIDRQDPTASLGWERELEKGRFNLSSSYSRTSTRVTQLQESGLVFNDGSSTTKSINAGWNRSLTERINWSLSGALSKTSFTGGGGFSQFNSKSLNSLLSYEVSDRLKPFINLGYTTYNSDESAQGFQKSQTYTGGASYQFNPKLSSSFSAGITRLSTGVAKVGEISVSYTGEQYQLIGTYSRNVTPSGVGGFQNADNISLNYGYTLSEKSNIGTSFNWRKNNSLNDVESKQISAFYSLSLTDYWLMRLSLQMREIKSINQSANGEVFGISFVYNTPEF
jgi:hypothetical protein